MIHRHPVGHPAAPIVASDREPFMTKADHQFDQHRSHAALGHGVFDFRIVRRVAFAVAGQVDHHDRVLPRQIWRYVAPHETRLRKSMEQE